MAEIFYSHIMKTYQVKYDGITANADLEDSTPDMLTKKQIKAWKAACKEVEKSLSPDALATKQAYDLAYYNNLRMICGSQDSFAKTIEVAIQQGSKPCCRRFVDVYSDMFYQLQIKSEVDVEFTQSADKSEKAWFSITKTKIKEHWDWELEAIKMMVYGKIKAVFQEAMMKYNSLWTGLKDKTTADYHL
ncbi:uncharacterized protein ARMOST_11691 [Armillaria ostoyae]|uniref:Uncharacterized protein n=1 Tax=Armillaria ostoyae TaxID=47428 RepID=A0A284RHT8_ARMOS|nr:uncharacterized protein ARMOST_11691 [Armillaria ostoyae]